MKSLSTFIIRGGVSRLISGQMDQTTLSTWWLHVFLNNTSSIYGLFLPFLVLPPCCSMTQAGCVCDGRECEPVAEGTKGPLEARASPNAGNTSVSHQGV